MLRGRNTVKIILPPPPPPQPITTPGIYWDETNGLISLSSDGSTWITIADKNLGATTVYNDGNTLSEANCGKYYQWGNNYGFPWTGSVTTSSTQVDASSYGPGNYYSSSTFINNNNGWCRPFNTNLWGGTTGTNEAMQGPCPSGYHIPKKAEWQTIINTGVSIGAWTSSGGNNIKKRIKLPYAGMRTAESGATANQGLSTGYWSTTPEGISASYCMLFTSSMVIIETLLQSNGYPIRPFKNVAIQPDTSRTVLYQPS